MFSDGHARDTIYEPFWDLEYAEMQGGPSFFNPKKNTRDDKTKRKTRKKYQPNTTPTFSATALSFVSIHFFLCVCGFCCRPLCTVLFLINMYKSHLCTPVVSRIEEIFLKAYTYICMHACI